MEQKLDLRVVKTYKLLHQAFDELLEKKSIDQITVGELCEKAMIRKTTFYLHFQDKYDYFNHYLIEVKEEFKRNVTTKIDINNFHEYSVETLHEMFQLLQRHRKTLVKLKNNDRMSFLYQALEKQIALEFQNVLLALDPAMAELDLQLMVSFYSGGLINILSWWLDHPDEIDENIISQRLVELVPLSIKKSQR